MKTHNRDPKLQKHLRKMRKAGVSEKKIIATLVLGEAMSGDALDIAFPDGLVTGALNVDHGYFTRDALVVITDTVDYIVTVKVKAVEHESIAESGW